MNHTPVSTFDSKSEARDMSPTIQEMQDFQRQQSQLQGYPNQLYHGYYSGQFQNWPNWPIAAPTSPDHTASSNTSTSNASPNPHQENQVQHVQIGDQTQQTEQEQQIYHPQMNHFLQHQVYHPQALQVKFLFPSLF